MSVCHRELESIWARMNCIQHYLPAISFVIILWSQGVCNKSGGFHVLFLQFSIRSLQCLSSTHVCGYTLIIVVIVLLLCWLYCRTTTGRTTVSSPMSRCVRSSVRPVRSCALHASVSPSTPSFGGPQNVSMTLYARRHVLLVSKSAHLANACQSTRTNGGLQIVPRELRAS